LRPCALDVSEAARLKASGAGIADVGDVPPQLLDASQGGRRSGEEGERSSLRSFHDMKAGGNRNADGSGRVLLTCYRGLLFYRTPATPSSKRPSSTLPFVSLTVTATRTLISSTTRLDLSLAFAYPSG